MSREFGDDPGIIEGRTERRIDLAAPGALLDGVLVHSEALTMGFSTLLFPGQSLLLSTGEAAVPQSFVHGVPEQTNLSMATMVQDKRVRRALLQAADIQVPIGATFTIGRGIDSAVAYAAKIGYPVVVKSVVGDSTIENQPDVFDADDLMRAIDYFRIAPSHREAFRSASYAFSALQTPKGDGSNAARSSYRFLIEEQRTGSYVRLLLLYGELVSAVRAPDGPWGSTAQDVLPDLHPSVGDLAGRIWSAVPGLSLASIDLVLSQGHACDIADQEYAVVEVGERPWLHLQNRLPSSRAAGGLASRIIAESMARSEVDIPPVRSGRVSVEARWEGVSSMEQFGRCVSAASQTLDLHVSLDVEDMVGGIAQGSMTGDAYAIALLNELLVDGRFPGERIMCAEIRSVGFRG